MNLSDLIDVSFSYRLITTLLHFLWQGSVIAALAMAGDWLLRRSPASQRYALHVTAMAMMAACVVITFWRINPHGPGTTETPPGMLVTADTEAFFLDHQVIDPSTLQSKAPLAFPGADLPLRDLPVNVDTIAVPEFPVGEADRPVDVEHRWESFRRWAPQMTLLYLVCCGLLLARLIRGTWVAHRLPRNATRISDTWLIKLLQQQSRSIGLRALPQMAWCAQVSVPLVIGMLRPMILLPAAAATGLSSDQLQALITHELAHIRRHDLLVNLLQRLFESLLFFHPAVWFVSRRISFEREQACDELVLSTGCERLLYADALVRMAELSSVMRLPGRPAPATSLAAAGTSSSEFKRRVLKVLLEPGAAQLQPSRLAVMIIVTLFCVVTLSATRLRLGVFADTPSNLVEDASGDGDASSAPGAPGAPAGGTTIELPGSQDEPNPTNHSLGHLQSSPASPQRDAKPPQAFEAVLPNGIRVEFVGITRNTAPAEDGWRPDGLPSQDVGYWPATTYRSGNTTGSFTENGPHPEPNAGALDLLFRFRGLKAQPSLGFDLSTSGSSYAHLPLKEPYQLRVTTERRDSAPPGGRWTIPDGEFRVGLTDEPWGRYVKITPDGKVPDPIQADERHASTYQLIRVMGAKTYERAPGGTVVQLHVPAGDFLPLRQSDVPTDPDKVPHRYAFEFRAIDTDGEEHWALEWQRSAIPNSELRDSSWGLAQPLPDGKTLSHYEFRVRPYRHWVTFENVSLQPGQQTEVKIKVESLPDDSPGSEPMPPRATTHSSPQLPTPSEATAPASDAGEEIGSGRPAEATEKTESEEPHGQIQQPPGQVFALPETELLQKLVRGGKIPTKTVNAWITQIAARAAQDPEFARLVLAEFQMSYAGGDVTSSGRRSLLAVLTEMFETWSSASWHAQLRRFKLDEVAAAVGTPVDVPFQREILGRVISIGYTSDRSEIASFTLAVRQMHDPTGRDFLRDVLRIPGSESTPFASTNVPRTVPAQGTPGPKNTSGTPSVGRWKDTAGGSWTDAKFVAAVGLAELGEVEGVDWLLARAQPNSFGIDQSLGRFPHIRDTAGALRESSRLALADLFGLPENVTVPELTDWRLNNQAQFTARPVMLKLHPGRGSADAAAAPSGGLPTPNQETSRPREPSETRQPSRRPE